MNNSLGDIIRDLRKEKKLTQEELAEGICSSVSISRIENGTQMPSSATLEKILAKLDASTYQLCDIYFKKEQNHQFEEFAEHAAGAINRGDIAFAKSLLTALEESENPDEKNYQTVDFIKGSILLYENSDEALDVLTKALSYTRPDFSFSNFQNVLFTVVEVNIISLIAAFYYGKGDYFKALTISKELYESLKNHKSDVKYYGVLRMYVAMTLAGSLLKCGSVSEALAVIDETENWALSKSEFTIMPDFQFTKARIIYQNGQKNEALKIIDAVLPYVQLIKKDKLAEQMIEFKEQTQKI